MSMLIRIIYVSKASSSLPLELKEILAVARKNNPSTGITGAMCLIDGVYLQYLEGTESVVDALYKKIESDSRHSVPNVLERRSISERTFPGWAMALLTWNDETKALFRRFNPDTALDAYEVDCATIDPLIRAWAGSKNWMTV